MKYLSLQGEKELWILNIEEFQRRKRRENLRGFPTSSKNSNVYDLANNCGQKCTIRLKSNHTSINGHKNQLNIRFTRWDFFKYANIK